jgi:hypothetical protein
MFFAAAIRELKNKIVHPYFQGCEPDPDPAFFLNTDPDPQNF